MELTNYNLRQKTFSYDIRTLNDWDYVDEHLGNWWNEVYYQISLEGYIPVIDTAKVRIEREEDSFVMLSLTIDGVHVHDKAAVAEYITSEGLISWRGTRGNRSKKSS